MIKKILKALKGETENQIKRAETLKKYLDGGSISDVINDFDMK